MTTKDPRHPTHVRDLMTTKLHTVHHNDGLPSVDKLMSVGRIRHVLVLDDEETLIGVVSQRDLFLSGLLRALGYGSHARQKAIDDLLVKEVMVTDPISTTPGTPLEEAAKVMFSKKIGCLPVVEHDRLIGILTESDFVRLFATPRRAS